MTLPSPARRVASLLLALAAIATLGRAPLAFADEAKTDDAKLTPVFNPPPRLAITAQELTARKADANFPAVRDAAAKAADALLAAPPALPDGFGSWMFYYACADDGTGLHAVSPTEHKCPKCGKVFSDERTVAAYRGILHSAADGAARTLAWGYAYTGDDKYVEGVKRILLKYADDYAKYPERIDRWGRRGLFAPLGGRRRVQSLEEAEGAMPLTQAYDLTRMSPAWKETEKKHVEADFFRATADTLRVFPMDIQNRQAWYNAALVHIGSVLEDPAMVVHAIEGPGGFKDQLARGVGDDGLWWEGTMAYQSYVVQPTIQLIDGARRMGIALQDNERFKLFLTSPLRAAYPDGSFPCINDSDPANFHMFDYSYEWAWNVYKDPRFAQALAWGKPDRLAALLGPDAKPASPLESKSADLTGIGVLYLRVGEGPDQVCATFHYGDSGGDASGHGHWDKLNLTLFAKGREWLADIGRIGYTHKEYKSWAKRTIAHNTIAIDQADQTVNAGRLMFFKAGPGFAAAAAESTKSYKGVTLRRYLYLTPDYLVDVFDVKADRKVTIDLPAHAITEPVMPLTAAGVSKMAPPLGTDNGYQHFTNVMGWSPTGNSTWNFDGGKAKGSPHLHVLLAGEPDERIYTAIGIGYRADEKAPTLIRRREATDTRFVAVYDLAAKSFAVRKIEAVPGAQPHVKVYLDKTTDDINFGVDGVQVGH
ncbi:MAG: heparinase II/III family protein [Planctomycetota bacterium]|nr:heparinase II/III family protein [Planctomycetota bacterium]